jgi:hypothetical protein
MNRHCELNNTARENPNGTRAYNPQQATPVLRESINSRSLHPPAFCIEFLRIEPEFFK